MSIFWLRHESPKHVFCYQVSPSESGELSTSIACVASETFDSVNFKKKEPGLAIDRRQAIVKLPALKGGACGALTGQSSVEKKWEWVNP